MARRETEAEHQLRRKEARDFLAKHGGKPGSRFGRIGPDDDPDKLIPERGPRGRRRNRGPFPQIGPINYYAVVDTNVLLEGVGNPGDEQCREIVGLLEQGLIVMCKMPGIKDELEPYWLGTASPRTVSLDEEAQLRLKNLMLGAISLFQGPWVKFRDLVLRDRKDSVFLHALHRAKNIFGPDRVWLVSRDAHLFIPGENSVLNPIDFMLRMKAIGILSSL